MLGGNRPLSKQSWQLLYPRPWQPARHNAQMTVRGWRGRNLDHGGAGGGAQGTRGVGDVVPARPGLVGAAWDRHSSGDGGGEWAGPSTCSSTLLSAGEAGEAAFLFFLDLVIIGEMSSPVEAVETAASTGAVAAGCSCRLLLAAVGGACCCCRLLLPADAGSCCRCSSLLPAVSGCCSCSCLSAGCCCCI